MTPAIEGRIDYLRQQIGHHQNQIRILQEELDELEGRQEEDAPEVEVTDTRSQAVPVGSMVPEVQERPPAVRRSGAKNVSAPEYQTAFISEARRHMGQPLKEDALALLGQRVELIFNVNWLPAKGVLTMVCDEDPPYLLLDNYHERRYPLYAIQEIRAEEASKS
jgi:hypothetical protein